MCTLQLWQTRARYYPGDHGPGIMGNERRDIGGQTQGGHWSPGHRHKYPGPG